MPMLNTRTLTLAGIAAVIAIVMVWKWVAGWGYVTLDVHNAPLAKVIKSIEWQGGVKISTNADPATPVTLIVDHVPAYDAVDALATAIEADTRLAYIAAKDTRQIKNVLAAFSSGNNPGGWVVLSGFGGRGGGGPREGEGQNGGRSRDNAQQGNQTPPQEQSSQSQTAQNGDQPRGERRQGGDANNGGERRGGGGDQGGGFGGWTPGPMGDSLTDPRTIVWKPSDMPEKTLKSFFDQGAQKTGAIFALPEGWEPAIAKVPKEGPIGKVTVRLAKSASGSVQEVFLLTVQPPRPQQTANNEDSGGRWEFTRTVFSPTRGGPRNQEWMAERMQAQIAALPPAEQAAVKKQMDEMRAFRESLQGLSEEERRAKFEEYMNRPDVQERMDERMSTRDSKTPPEKREKRMKQYLERKNQMKGPSQKS